MPHPLVTDLYGQMSLPVISAPMFIVSNPKLVLAQCTSGVIGSFPALNARPQSLLNDWLDEIQAGLASYREAHPAPRSRPTRSIRSSTSPTTAWNRTWPSAPATACH